jgi:hypothetical protein
LFLVSDSRLHGHELSRADVLWTSGQVPIWLRVLTLPFLVGVLWGISAILRDLVGTDGVAAQLGHSTHPLIALAAMTALGIFFVGTWIWNNWLYLDPSAQILVMAHRGLLGVRRKHIPVSEIRAIGLQFGRIRANRFWNVSIVEVTGKRVWFTRTYSQENEARAEFRRLADALKCPVTIDGARTG